MAEADLPTYDDIQPERVHALNDKPVREDAAYVLYWMQAAQRTRCNHALTYAVRRANELGLPCVVCFGLTDGYPEANARHYAFMLQGLRDVEANLKAKDIKLCVEKGDPADVAAGFAKDAALLVSDMSYTRPARQWVEAAADEVGCQHVQVEGEVVVPVEHVSEKQEYAARTIRPKLHKTWGAFFVPLTETKVKKGSVHLKVKGSLDVSDPAKALAGLDVDGSVPPVKRFEGGEDEAQRRWRAFLGKELDNYDDGRNEPADEHHSTMSPYLHFGHIAPLQLALEVRDAANGSKDDREAYVEELVVRRELAKNFVWYAPHYDSYKCLPDWAKKTLDEHRDDERPARYTRQELEDAATDDEHWNAAMREMRSTGFMANYMRMYWGKKILEWCNTPEYAHETTLHLNNKYFLDGRDPNSYSNVAWVFGLHDRPWTEREVFGKIRYMNANGLKRKFDMPKYHALVDKLESNENA